MQRWLIVGLATALAAPALAQPPRPREIRTGRDDARAARRDVREARRAGRGNAQDARREMREAIRSGDRIEVREARQELREARQEAREEVGEAREDLREERAEARDEVREAAGERREARRERARTRRDVRQEIRRTRARRAAERLGLDPDDSSPQEFSRPVRRELARHARRLARIDRMSVVAQEADKTGLLERIEGLRGREVARHQRRMARLAEEGRATGDADDAEAGETVETDQVGEVDNPAGAVEEAAE